MLLTNFREQALEGMGLSYEQLKGRFPRLIHAAVLGYGSEGPDKDRPGYDYTTFFSRTGLMADLPPPAAAPWCPSAASVTTVWQWLWWAASAPLCTAAPSPTLATRWTCPCISPAFSFSAPAFSTALTAACCPEPGWTAATPAATPIRAPTESGSIWPASITAGSRELCQLIGHPELAEDPKYSTNTAYYANRTELTKIFDEIFNKQPVSYWDELFNEHDMPHEVLRHFKDVPYDLQAQVNHYTYFHEYPDGTKTVFTNGPVHFASVDPANIPCRVSGAIGGTPLRSWMRWAIRRRKSPPCTKPRRSDKPSISNSPFFSAFPPPGAGAQKKA